MQRVRRQKPLFAAFGRRQKPLFAAFGLCALLAVVVLRSAHVDSFTPDHVTAHCAACHLVRSWSAAALGEATVLHGPTLLADAVVTAPAGEVAPAPTPALGSRAPPAV